MQVARFAKSFPSATISLFLRRSAHSLLPGGSLSLQSGAAAAETERWSFSVNGRSEGDGEQLREQRCTEGHLLFSGGIDWQLCGRGDKRTKKGKRFKGTFGNCRHRKNWNTQRLREKWEMPAVPAPGSLLPRPFPPLLTRY